MMISNDPTKVDGGSRGTAWSDEEVVARVRAGDTALYEVLMRRHNRTVYRVVRSVLRGDDEVEDVMQQAYVSAFAKLDQFRSASRFSTWLVAVALNEARGRVRKRTLHAIADAENADPPPPAPHTPENEVAMREYVALVERAVEQLPAVYRSVFVLRHVEGLDTSETAAALGVSEDVVKTRLHRACVLLRER
ncbi:MAG TPA: RNA polymerase sigma factor, partial [Anaeromyxobacteraceae bacterium]|nr:RNA polymerase sigma factor [Anaeromyxobacteraceae bacterium]